VDACCFSSNNELKAEDECEFEFDYDWGEREAREESRPVESAISPEDLKWAG
jgi:hypothetical protein